MRHPGRPLLGDARRTATRRARAALVVAACVVTAFVPAGVIGLRWHYFTDTVGGVALGTATVLALAFLIDLASGLLRSRQLPRIRHRHDFRVPHMPLAGEITNIMFNFHP
jgi:membrane-associated phospholipid phosphatase